MPMRMVVRWMGTNEVVNNQRPLQAKNDTSHQMKD